MRDATYEYSPNYEQTSENRLEAQYPPVLPYDEQRTCSLLIGEKNFSAEGGSENGSSSHG